MIESNVIRYGEEFIKSMKSRSWDLSKVNLEELSKSQATLVFGQMNEPRSKSKSCPSGSIQWQIFQGWR